MEDALMLNTEGHVACTTIANIFLAEGPMLVTPARDQGILTGVIAPGADPSAAHLGYKAEERADEPAELKRPTPSSSPTACGSSAR